MSSQGTWWFENDSVAAELLLPGSAPRRIVFARNVLQALKRAGYTDPKRLRKALNKFPSLNEDTRKQTLQSWRHYYNDLEEGRLASPKLCRRLLDLIPKLIPQYANLEYLVDSTKFERSIGVGSSYPPALRRPMAEAFERWLSEGKEPLSPEQTAMLAGEYFVYFPWLQEQRECIHIARARARIQRLEGVWTFSSSCNPPGFGPLFFAGQLRFVGVRSVVVVGFTSFTPPPVTGQVLDFDRAQTEMLFHPYRMPAETEGWWQGSTAFLDAKTLEYAGTVGHVMRRISSSPPVDNDWFSRSREPSLFLRNSSPERDDVLREIEQCIRRPC